MGIKKSVYLAGPEVFFPAPIRDQVERAKRVVLDEFDLVALSPCDNELDLDSCDHPAMAIYQANQRLMDRAHGLAANLVPFRGPSADAGTIFELGYMVAQGKPAVGFSVCATSYCQRVEPVGTTDAQGCEIEPFGLGDNLMLDCGLIRSGGAFVCGDQLYPRGGFTPQASFSADVFRRAIAKLAENL